MPHDEAHQDQTLLKYFSVLDRKDVKMTVAGKIGTAAEAQSIMDAGIDFVSIGRAAILHHDYPDKVMGNPEFEPVALPVSREHLAAEGLSETFIKYMTKWEGFVSQDWFKKALASSEQYAKARLRGPTNKNQAFQAGRNFKIN